MCPFALCKQSFAHICISLKFHGSISLLILPPLPMRSKIVLEPCCSLEVVAHIVVSFCQWGACSPSGSETNAALSDSSLFRWTWAFCLLDCRMPDSFTAGYWSLRPAGHQGKSLWGRRRERRVRRVTSSTGWVNDVLPSRITRVLVQQQSLLGNLLLLFSSPFILI